jgi:hypothetical protein
MNLTLPRAFRGSRYGLVLLAAIVLALIALVAKPSDGTAAIAGQQSAFGEWGPEPGKFFDPLMFGADSTDGSVYVANLSFAEEGLRLEKFSAAGTVQGSTLLPRSEEGSGPKGYVGIAVDGSREKFYVLRNAPGLDSREPSKRIATKILVFSTKPNLSGKLEQVAELPVPAPEEAKTLFEPREIAVDPNSGELVVLAKDFQEQVVLQRIKTSGAGGVGERYVESGALLQSEVSMAVDSGGTTYVLSDGIPGEEGQVNAFTLAANFATSTLTPLPGFGAAAVSEGWGESIDFLASPLIASAGLGLGPQVAVTSSPSGEKTLYWKSVSEFSSNEEPGDIVVHGYSLADEATSVAYGGGATEGQCRIQTGSAALGAGTNGSLVVLDQGQRIGSEGELPAYFAIVSRFGPGGSGCPAPAASIKLTEGSGGPEVSTVAPGTTVTLDGSGKELNGQTLSEMTWRIEGGSGGPIVLHGEKPTHVFADAGTYTIRLNMKTSVFAPIGTNFVAAAKKLVVGSAPVGPAITGLNPKHGPEAGGTSVTIAGSGFTGTTGATGVKFGATNATAYTVDSDTQITATAPAGAGTVNVVVTNGANSSPNTAADDYTYDPPAGTPTVTAVAPAEGPAAGGTAVTITGTGFTGASCPTAVQFGGTAATSCNVVDATHITATSPAHAAGKVHVTVTNGGLTSVGTAADEFEFKAGASAPTVTLIAPAEGPAAGGTAVTIIGTGFTGASCPTAVQFGGTNATSCTVVDATHITANSPAHAAGRVHITVTNGGLTSASTAADEFEYKPPTVVNRTLTIKSAGTGSGSVKCNGGTCSPSYPSGTELTLSASPAAGSTFAGWSGGECGGTGNCVIKLTVDTSVTASFNSTQSGGGSSGGGGGRSSGGTTPPPSGGKKALTPAQKLAAKKAAAKAKCKKLHGKAKAKCMKAANQIGKPKKKKGKKSRSSSARPLALSGWAFGNQA